MAYYAQLKRIQWYCINGLNMIQWYRKKRYDDWYSSLTDEQKEELERRKRVATEVSYKEAIGSLAGLLYTYDMIASRCNNPFLPRPYGACLKSLYEVLK